jgi:hypothetical protein
VQEGHKSHAVSWFSAVPDDGYEEERKGGVVREIQK